MRHAHIERHRSHVGGWLRASVLGANDGIVSTASLVLGVAATQASPSTVLAAGLAGLRRRDRGALRADRGPLPASVGLRFER